jgi:hypothetical protein
MTKQSNAKAKTPQGKASGSQHGGNGLNGPDEQVYVRHENRNVDKGRENQGNTNENKI